MNFLIFCRTKAKKPLCKLGEQHEEMWCCGACSAAKFLKPIIKNFKKEISIYEKKIFFMIQCFKKYDILGHTLESNLF